ncbi:MAG TPA: hypothetical protein VGI60_16000 [Chthoniobacterales bacterium]|jgi:hypothetical protein
MRSFFYSRNALTKVFPAAVFGSLCWLVTSLSTASPSSFRVNPDAGAGDVIVHGKLGGLIFGFDIDPTGSEGLLCEAVLNSDGTVSARVETFSQSTGRFVDVLGGSESQDDFVTWGIARSIGLVEKEHVKSLFHVERIFRIISPLSGNQINGIWTPPIDRMHVINQVKPSPDGSSNVAVYAVSVSDAPPILFTSDLATNTFGSVINVTHPDFITEAPPVIAFDVARNQVILGHDKPSGFIEPPVLGFVDLATGLFVEHTGRGLGVINGIAVDSEDGVLCTDTSFDSGAQFFNLDDFTGINVLLPGANPQNSTASGADVEFDPVNKLFLIAQPFSDGMLDNGSSIQVYDLAGNLVESVNSLNFQGGDNVFPIHIALNPRRRIGFVNGPDLTTAIQSFTY